MKAAAICNIGLEEVCKDELKSLGAKNPENGRGSVLFEVDDYYQLGEVAYNSRCSSRIFHLFLETKIKKSLSETRKIIEKGIKTFMFSDFLLESSTFKVECERAGEHEFSSADFESELGEIIISKINSDKGYKQKVALDNPDTIIFSQITGDNCLIGVDFCGFDMSRRDYHIFTNKTSIKGTLAAALLLFSCPKKGQTILDVFCGSGTIVIEAALFANGISPQRFRKNDFIFRRIPSLKDDDWNAFFEKVEKKAKKTDLKIIGMDPLLANTKAASKNAKIAGIQKDIAWSRADIDWLDLKVDKANIDKIISRLPSVSQHKTQKDIEKLYREFFYQADYILKKSGEIVALLSDETLFGQVAKKYKFEAILTKDIMIGKQNAKVVLLKRS